MRLSRCLIWVVIAAPAGLCQAQVMQSPGTMPGRRIHIPEPPPHQAPSNPSTAPQPGTPSQPSIQTGATAIAPNPAPNLPPSLLDKPAGAAHVTLSDGSLSVNATNSSLSEILKKLEATSGMTVDGFDKDSRVFGVYGPGPPRDVLASLLDGAGYNFLMVGSTNDGTPREIVLTARSNAPISAPTPGSSQAEEPEDDTPNYPPPPVETPQPVPPQGVPPAEQRPRTPQEMLQELQRLRQQQQQQPQGQSPQQ